MSASVFATMKSHPVLLQEAQQVDLTQSLMGSLLFSLQSWCIQDLVRTLQEWNFRFPQSCGISVMRLLWLSKSDSLVTPPLLDPKAGKPDLGSEFSLLQANFCSFFFFSPPVCSLLTCCVSDLISLQQHPSSRLTVFSFVFECRVSFLVGSSIFFYQWLFSGCDSDGLSRMG